MREGKRTGWCCETNEQIERIARCKTGLKEINSEQVKLVSSKKRQKQTEERGQAETVNATRQDICF